MEALLVALTILAGAMIQPARNHDRQQAQQQTSGEQDARRTR